MGIAGRNLTVILASRYISIEISIKRHSLFNLGNFSSTLSGLDYHQFHSNPSQCECNTLSYLCQPEIQRNMQS